MTKLIKKGDVVRVVSETPYENAVIGTQLKATSDEFRGMLFCKLGDDEIPVYTERSPLGEEVRLACPIEP